MISAMLYAICYMLHATCHILYAICHPLYPKVGLQTNREYSLDMIVKDIIQTAIGQDLAFL